MIYVVAIGMVEIDVSKVRFARRFVMMKGAVVSNHLLSYPLVKGDVYYCCRRYAKAPKYNQMSEMNVVSIEDECYLLL